MDMVGLIFFATACFILLGGIHWFVYDRLARVIIKTTSSKRVVAVLFFTLSVASIVGIFFIKVHQSAALYYIGSIWLGIISIWFTVFIFVSFLSPFLREVEKPLTWLGISIMIGISSWSLYNGLQPAIVREFSGVMPRMGQELNGFTIAFLPDMHITRFTSHERVRQVVRSVNSHKPDLIIIGGDLVDDEASAIKPQVYELAKLQAKVAILAVFGNHEYYTGVDNFYKIAKRIGMTTMRNEQITLPNGLQILAIDDPEGKSYANIKSAVRKLGRHMDLQKPSILVSHRQEAFELARKLDVGLTLSGHTHGGQIPPLDIFISLFGKYPMGMHKEGFSTLYTSYGVGTWGPPMRFLSHSEVVIIRLRSDILSGHVN